MELYKELLNNILNGEKLEIEFTKNNFDIENIMRNECYILLGKIKTVTQDDSLSDFECVEKIVCLFENSGIKAGNRHDFG